MTQQTKKRPLNPINILTFIFNEERRSSMLLVAAALAALLLANSGWSVEYFRFFAQTLELGGITLDIKHWINEGLMALFFLVVGLEIKRELIDGELRTFRKALFPLCAAIGGMLVPALIFALLNPYQPQSDGWAIPMATDIAIAAGVLALLGRHAPKNLRVFLLALAIIDDIGSIAIIGLFYSQPTNTFALLIAVTLSLGLLVARRWRYWPLGFLGLGLAIWYSLLLAGVSGTMAGVIVAMAMPLVGHRSAIPRLQTSEKIEDILIPVASFVIVPLFVLANAGIRFSGVSMSSEGSLSVFAGVLLGLLLGKPLGIVGATWLAEVLKIAHKPSNINWGHITGVGFLAGIGFTISLLITDLAYSSSQLQDAAVLGIFTASVLAGIVGLMTLRHAGKPRP